jgi:hypothetical protein
VPIHTYYIGMGSVELGYMNMLSEGTGTVFIAVAGALFNYEVNYER